MTDAQRAELEALGPETVRIELIQAGPGQTAVVPGFNAAVLRRDAEQWLGEKSAQEATERRRTLLWAVIAGVAAFGGVAVSVAAIFLK